MTVGIRERALHLGPERRRPQVLDTALALALERGVAAVSMAAIAERLGVTRPVVYACFTDRTELLHALLDREEQRLLHDVLAALPQEPERVGPEARFVRGFQALLTTVAARPDSWRVVFAAEPDPAVAGRFARARGLVADQARAQIRPALEHWGTADLERKLPVLVEQFMSSCEGAVRSLLDPSSDWTPHDLGELVGRAVHRAFRSA